MGFLDETYYGNSVQAYLIGAAIAIGVLVAARLLRTLAARRLHSLALKTTNRVDDLAVDLLARTKFTLLLVVAIYAGTYALVLDPPMARLIGRAAAVAVLLQLGIWTASALLFWLDGYQVRKRAEGDPASAGAVAAVGFLARVTVWLVVVLLVLDNAGVDVTALVAGLGVGGIAIALALQKILGDLFASVSIMLDKPFEVGDAINVAGLGGTVESIGLKSTRVRGPAGEELIFSNADLLASRIHNFKRMQERKASFFIAVPHRTPIDLVERIPGLLRDIVAGQEQVRFDRAHLRELADTGYRFEVAFTILKPDLVTYLDAQQAINLAILRAFEVDGIELAIPARAVLVKPAGAPGLG